MRTVLVTGGTVRLGKAIADHLRAAGWRVLTSSHRPGSGADIIADLSEPMGAAKLYAGCLNLLGGNPPDALVNNAALFTGDEAAMASVNLEAPRKLVMMMAGREDGRGKVVNILDTRVLSQPAADAYGRTKRDLMEWSAKAAAMFADTLNVNSVAPGPVLAPVDVHEAAGECPLGRPTPEAVARAVGFLLEADYTSGCVIPVDGGRSL
jgi:NAD(P)-dependent dehydrogenase (short-subunit alcohol dehydrogenase family)